jgi:putative two-component system hydrogenase maturation factor HypX/HoxX
MRILLLVQSFNGLSQRLYVELAQDGHELSVEFDIHERVTQQAVELFEPEVILAPFLRRAIAPSIWQRYLCLIVHPGPPGDRGPAALDWAILRALREWGVCVLQATAALDAGPIWAHAAFPMRLAAKSSLYRHEVTEGAVETVRLALQRVADGLGPLYGVAAPHEAGGWQPQLSQAERRIDWNTDDTTTVLRKIHSADGSPGLLDRVLGRGFRLFDAHPAPGLRGVPGALLARSHEAICRATRDGAVWIGQLQPVDGVERGFKRPAALALGALADALPREDVGWPCAGGSGEYGEIQYQEQGAVGWLHFNFYNGALSVARCERLRAAYAHARARPTRVIVLMGGSDFWCNGMHLHCIEAADSPADASWDTINSINDLVRDILTTDTHHTIAALHGNAAAGGVFMALAADRVLARSGIVLNPHYRNMGNLHGSEYWTYTLPRRVGTQLAQTIAIGRLPLGTAQALALGLIDGHAGPDTARFRQLVYEHASELASSDRFALSLGEKRARRERDEAERPLAQFRSEELAQMLTNFYGFDPSYHIARHRFVHRTPHAWTPLYLARHRRLRSPARPAAAGA